MTSEPAASTVDNKQPAAQLFEPTTNTSNTNTRKETNVIVASTGVSQGKVALPIKPVLVKGANSVCVMTYALHDNGSSGSFCSEGLLKKLGLPAKTVTANLTTVDRKELEVKAKIVDLELESVVDGTTYKMYQVLTRESLNISTDNMASAEELTKWDHLAGVDIPDIDTSEVELLIGQDNPGLLVPLEVREGREGEPFAVRTRLGWGINGPRSEDRPNNFSTHYVDLNLEKQVEKFWRLDDPSSHNGQALSISDKKVIALWESSIKRDGSHYSLGLPFKHRPPCLPDNYHMAKQRLNLLGKRLLKDSELKEKYTQSIQDSLAKGYAEEVSQEDLHRNDGYVWYLPHHPVVHPRKPGKVRLVYDCAARCQGISLNDCIYQGPDLANKLIGVLLRFRQDRVAIMADIEGMFDQVRVHREDRDVLRFLWPRDNDFGRDPKTYRMTTHLFGGVWSPSCANFTLKRTAEEYGGGFDAETIKTVDNNFYVDDCLKSVPTEEAAIRLVEQLRELLALGGFRLTKWLSNSREVIRTLPEPEKAKSIAELDLDKDGLPSERALGVLWSVEEDNFTFDTNVKEKPLTKRGLLSVVSSVYDPLGFVSPFVLPAKMIFQSLCRRKLGWDEEMPKEFVDQWNRWLSDLATIAKIKIPRCLKPCSDFKQPISAQLHHFSDASEQGLGAVNYLRLLDNDGKVHCSLVMAKAKLAPLKTTTIPRLELAAAVVSTRLDKCIREHLEMPLMETVYWTDSMIVLQYLRNEDKRFQTFVANRIAEIRDHSSPLQWRHV